MVELKNKMKSKNFLSQNSAPPPPVLAGTSENDIISDEFLPNLLKFFESDIELSTPARSLFNNIALDFVKTISRQAIDIAKSRGSEDLEEKDVNYVLKHFYGIEIPSSEKNSSPDYNFKPTDDYLAKLSAVRAAKKK